MTEQIAHFHRVKPENVLLCLRINRNPSGCSLRFCRERTATDSGDADVRSGRGYARAVGSEVVSVPLDPGYAHDLGAMLARTNHPQGWSYICNPNNPTSSLTPRKAIEDFVDRLPASTRVLIDEAYYQYVVPDRDVCVFIDAPLNDERVIVTRTFSTAYGLAGLRLGYAVAAPSAIEAMRKLLTANSLNAIVAEVVGVALDDVRDWQSS